MNSGSDQQTAKSYIFGSYRLDVASATIWCDGVKLPLTNRTFEILKYLVEHAGEVVSKESLLKAVWHNYQVEESNLPQQIYRLRQLLSEPAKAPLYIITIPGVGYVFSGQVVVVDGRGVDRQPATQEDLAAEAEPPVERVETANEALPTPALPASPRHFSRQVVMSAIALSAIFFGLIRADLISYRKKPSKASLITPLTSMPGNESYPRFSPDGRFVAFVWEGEGDKDCDIYVSLVGMGDPIQVTKVRGCETNLAWSPDGQFLAFLRAVAGSEKPQLMMIPAIGGNEQKIAEVWGGLDWSPDGRLLAVSDSNSRGKSTGIWMIPVGGGERWPVSNPPDDPNCFDSNPQFSSDGQKIAFVRCFTDFNCSLFVKNLVSGDLRQVTSEPMPITDIQWSSGGDELLFAARKGDTQRVWRLPAGGGVPHSEPGVPFDVRHFDISKSSGEMAYTLMADDTLVEVLSLPSNTSETFGVKSKSHRSHLSRCIIDSSRNDYSPRLSPDGRFVAFDSNRTGWDELWMANSNCNNVNRLTNFQQYGVGSLHWSPDGRSISFSRAIDGQGEILVISSDGTNPRRLTSHPANDILPGWSSDSQSIYFLSNRENGLQIWKIPAAGGEATRVTLKGGFEARESADGRMLFFSWNGTLWQKDLRTGEELLIPELRDFIINRQWSLTPHAIYYVPENQTPYTVWRFDLIRRRSEAVMEINGEIIKGIPSVSVSADEKTMALSYAKYLGSDILLLSALEQ